MNALEMIAMARAKAMSEALFGQKLDTAIKVSQIRAFISKVGGPLESFYIGITKSIPQRFSDHKIEPYHQFDYFDCGNHFQAREIENTFLAMGLAGGDGGGNYESTWIYVYKMDLFTEPGFFHYPQNQGYTHPF